MQTVPPKLATIVAGTVPEQQVVEPCRCRCRGARPYGTVAFATATAVTGVRKDA